MGYAAQGTALQMGDGGSPEAFTAIGGILNVNGPQLDRPAIDDTALADVARKYIDGGVVDGGELTFELSYDPADTQQTGIYGKINSATAQSATNFRLILSDAGAEQWDFSAFVTGFSINSAQDDRATASVTLRVNSTGAAAPFTVS